MRRSFRTACLFLSCLAGGPVWSDTVSVRYPEGVVRGFLLVRAPGGAVIADGDLFQSSRGDRVTSRLVFHFRDGSLQDETAVFSQRERFALVSDRLVQRGPSFPKPLDLSIDAASGRIVVRYREGKKEKVVDERVPLPPDLANGLVSTLLKNLAPETASTTMSIVVAAPKPRIVKLAVTREGLETLPSGGASLRLTRFRIKVEIGGIAGAVAPIVGKEPRDASVWIAGGEAPGFVMSESQFYEGAPLWRIELTAPGCAPATK